MKFINFLFCLLVFSLILGQLGRLPLVGEGINLYFPDLILPVLIFVWLTYVLGIRKSLKLPPLSHFIFIFIAVATLSLLNAKHWLQGQQFLVSAMYLIRWIVYSSIYFIAFDLSRRNRGLGRKKMINLLIASGFLLAIFGFVQLVILPDFQELAETQGWDPHKNRLASTFLDPNFAGAYLVLALNLVFNQIIHPKTKKSWLMYLMTGIIFTALILTFSRSAWLMLGVSVFIFGLLRSRKILLISLVIFFSAYFFVPRIQTRIAGGVDPDDSASLRFKSWQKTVEVIKKYPLIGCGFNTFRYAQDELGLFGSRQLFEGRSATGSDSSLLFVWATTGIIGLLIYLSMIGKVTFDALKTLSKPLSLVILTSLGALLVESNFINSLFYPAIMFWVWVLLGM